MGWALDPEYGRTTNKKKEDVFEAMVRVLDDFPEAREAVAMALGERAG